MFSRVSTLLLLSFSLLRCDAAVTDLIVIEGTNVACPWYFSKVKRDDSLSGDLNQKAGGKDLWLCVRYSTISQQDSGITDLRVFAQGSSTSGCGPLGWGWYRIRQEQGSNGDLNQSAGGKWVYLCYRKDTGQPPIEDIKLAEHDCDSGMYRITPAGDSNGDLNQSAGGKDIWVCIKHGCIATEVQGRWAPHGTIVGQITETWEHGTSKTHAESKTEDWSQSVSITVTQGWSLFGQGGSASITGTISHSTSNTYSREWTVDEKYTFQLTWPQEYKGKASWQFRFESSDTCSHREDTFTREFAVTEGQFRPPCCVPGYALDAPYYTICRDRSVMIANGEQYGCSVGKSSIAYKKYPMPIVE